MWILGWGIQEARTGGLTPTVAVDSGSSLLPSKQTLGRWKESHPFRGARLEACLLPVEVPAAPFLWNPEPHMLSLSPTTTSPLLVQGCPIRPLQLVFFTSVLPSVEEGRTVLPC